MRSLAGWRKVFKTRLAMSLSKLSLSEYAIRWLAQSGICASCKQPETATTRLGAKKHLCVDRDPTGGKVLSLLCNRCKRVVDCLRDNPAFPAQLRRYLEEAGSE